MCIYCSKIVQQQAVHKDVAPTNFAQEKAFGCVVEEVGIVPGKRAVSLEEVAQEVMA